MRTSIHDRTSVSMDSFVVIMCCFSVEENLISVGVFVNGDSDISTTLKPTPNIDCLFAAPSSSRRVCIEYDHISIRAEVEV